ncbi:hypothetical protein HKX48_003399 [Thoreauomyces humboldtii]|nr:hypothetical protein HKX48_003399 [Thoreauomyces humboldtii]
MSTVQLYVYDLSQGMARMMSRQLTGKQIDAIYHTSVVVYGVEYFFGQGIMESTPGQTHHGVPLEVVKMGDTEIPKDFFLEYLQEMKGTWTASRYHLLDNNCNTFSNELCNFLVGRDIPAHITGLPAEFLSTPFGQSILPMLENMFGPSQIARSATAASTAATATASLNPALASLVGNLAAAAQSAPAASTVLQTAQTLTQFNSILASHRCVVADFTSQSCPPCRVISPEFERLTTELNAAYHQRGMGQAARADENKVVGVKIEVGSAREIAAKYSVTATPTFVLFLDGKEFGRFSGANKQELKSQMEFLLYSAYPPHAHAKIRTPVLDNQARVPILYKKSSAVDAIFGKLTGFCLDAKAPESVLQALPSLQSALKSKYEAASGEPLQFVSASTDAVDWMLKNLSTDAIFPVLDILRLIVLDDAPRKLYLARTTGVTLMSVISRYGAQENAQPVPKAVRLMVLRLACNLFISPESTSHLLSVSFTHMDGSVSTPHRSVATALLIDSLLSPDAGIRHGAVSLAFNMALEEANSRQSGAGVASETEDVGIHEEWICELVAAACNALSAEEDDEMVLRLLTAVAHLLRFATSPVLQLAAVIGAGEAVTAKRDACKAKLKAKTKEETKDVLTRLKTTVELCDEVDLLLKDVE